MSLTMPDQDQNIPYLCCNIIVIFIFGKKNKLRSMYYIIGFNNAYIAKGHGHVSDVDDKKGSTEFS